nr:PREDICTED: A disintegrin and metalloproteinase with thrombospondin motifs 12-like isoform X1 [Linepithema humile]
MFFILKLVIIILINKTNAYVTQEIMLLPAWNPAEAKEIPLTLKVFGKLIQLNLRRNDQIASPVFAVWKYNAKDVTEKLLELKASNPCFYFHEDRVNSTTLNFCQERGFEGLVFVENDILEIRPLQNVFAPLSFIDDFCVKEQINQSFGKPHLIKRLVQHYDDSNFYHLNNFKRKPRRVQKKQERFTIELAVFVDVEAYRMFKFFLFNDTRIHDMIIVYVNQIQTFFHHPSLDAPVDISLVYLNIMDEQPLNLPVLDGDSIEMLYSFCNYSKILNPPSDNDENHWDIGLYITGMDIFETMSYQSFYNYTNISEIMQSFGNFSTFRNFSIQSTSYPDGACYSKFSCAIVEFTLNEIIESGIKSSLLATREIGHLLGLRDDFIGRQGEYKDTYIMSPEAQPYSEIKWSTHSRDKIQSILQRKLCLRDYALIFDDDNDDSDYDVNWSTYDIFDNPRYHDLPGRIWTAKEQCEIFMRDKDANVVTLLDICKTLQCETPNRGKSYFAGRALNGTHCSHGKECRGGECVPVIEPPYNFKFCKKDNWGEWEEDSCKSSCLKKSKGILVKRRFCKHRTVRSSKCEGPYYDVVLCNNSSLCIKKEWTIDEFTTKKCDKFRKLAKLTNLTVNFKETVPGEQYHHDAEKPWIACTVYCRKAGTFDYYAPRLEMLSIGVDPYFPDGTWCHKKNGQNYYCRQHYCLPEIYL